ncbi:MAG: PilZ domain-containing protein [Gammaproteobacteria bacterium]|nr:PilZ domain-containing protein [Gammaproteobacteria bacterium]
MNQESNSEKRRFSRILFDAPVGLANSARDKFWQSQLIDISLKGALVKKPDSWAGDDDDEFEVNVQLNNNDLLINMQASIAHQSEDMIGFKCVNIDLDSATCLKRLVELNLSDSSLLERELDCLMTSENKAGNNSAVINE